MDNTVLIIYLFKTLVILAGLFFVFLGYRLFVKGITAPAGDLEGRADGKGSVRLTRFAPGIFFALVGTVVVVVGATRKFSMATPGRSYGTESAGVKDSAYQYLESAGSAVVVDTTAPAPHDAGGTFICDTCDVQAP